MKKLFGFALVGASALTLASCGGSNGSGDVNVLNDLTEEQVYALDADITFWHAFTEDGVAYNALDDLIVEFNKVYPNISVKHQTQGRYDDLRDNTITSLTAKNNPTMVIAYTDHTASYVDSDAVLPLDSYINRETFGIADELDDFVPGYLAEGTVYDEAGTYYALPFNKSTEVLYVNKTLLDSYGVTLSANPTWTEVEAAATKANNDNRVGLIWDSAPNAFITLAEQYSAPYTSVTSPHYLFDDSKTETAVTYFTDKAETTGTFTSNSGSGVKHPMYATTTYWSGGYASGYFNEQNTAMVIGSSAGANYYKLTDAEIGIYPIPQYDTNHKAAIQQGTNINILSANTTDEQRLAAWLFTQYMVLGEGNATFAATSGYLPVTDDAYLSNTYQEFIASGTQIAKAAQVGYAQRDAYFVSPAFVGSANARLEVGNIITEVAYNSKTYQAAAKAAIDELEA